MHKIVLNLTDTKTYLTMQMYCTLQIFLVVTLIMLVHSALTLRDANLSIFLLCQNSLGY